MLYEVITVYEEKPSSEEFMEEWMALMKGRSGERGIFNRGGLMTQTPKRRLDFWKKKGVVENGHVITSYSIHYTKLYERLVKRYSGNMSPNLHCAL